MLRLDMRLPSTTVLVVALLVPLAGCAGLVGPSAQETATFAPGVSTDRVTDATALDEGNRAILRNTSYTYTSNYSQRVSADGYDYAVDHDTRVWVAADGSYLYHHRGVVTESETSATYVDGVWANESVAVMRTVDVENDSVTYTRYRPPEPYSAANTTRSGISDSLEEATVTETWNESGSAYARVRANESESNRWQGADGNTVTLTTRHEAVATVREDGFVPSLNSSLSGERPLPVAADDSESADSRAIAQIRDQTRIRYSAVGTTDVPRPDWVDVALGATEGLSDGETSPPRGFKNSS